MQLISHLFSYLALVTLSAACASGPAAPPPTVAAATARLDAEPLWAAIGSGDAAAVAQLVQRDPSLAMARTGRGTSAIQVALFRIKPNGEDFYAVADNTILQALLAAHPRLDAYETAALGEPAALTALLAADPALMTHMHAVGWTLLHFAAFGGNAAAARLLLDRGAALEQPAANQFANTPLHVALLTGDRPTVQLLVDRGANLAARYDAGTTPLQLAAGLGRVDLVGLLLDRGAQIDARSDRGASALSIAEAGKHAAVVELLRRRGATATAR